MMKGKDIISFYFLFSLLDKCRSAGRYVPCYKVTVGTIGGADATLVVDNRDPNKSIISVESPCGSQSILCFSQVPESQITVVKIKSFSELIQFL